MNVLHPAPFSLQYEAPTHSVSLLLSGKQAFARRGQITVIAATPNEVSGATRVLPDGGHKGQAGDDGVFTILPKASGIARASLTRLDASRRMPLGIDWRDGS